MIGANRIRLQPAALMLMTSLVLNSCVPLPSAPVPASAAASTGGREEGDPIYRKLHAAGEPVLQVDTMHSLVVIEVRRGGTLARLGHDHVVASRDVRGWIAPQQGRADLVIPLDSLTVDEPTLRAKAGLVREMPPQAIEGTRRNMLDKVLETSRYPNVQVRVTRRTPHTSIVHIALTVHGITRNMDVPVRVATQGKDLSIAGQLSFRQSDFGIVPFSVMGGALQVEDRVDLRFEIVATPVSQ